MYYEASKWRKRSLVPEDPVDHNYKVGDRVYLCLEGSAPATIVEIDANDFRVEPDEPIANPKGFDGKTIYHLRFIRRNFEHTLKIGDRVRVLVKPDQPLATVFFVSTSGVNVKVDGLEGLDAVCAYYSNEVELV